MASYLMKIIDVLQVKINGRYPNLSHRGLSRRTFGGRVGAGQQSPDMLTVVPGTEILPSDGNVQASQPLMNDMLENRERMAALKESLLKAPGQTRTTTPGESLVNPSDVKEMSDNATKVVSDLLKSMNEQSAFVQSESASIGKSAIAEVMSFLDSVDHGIAGSFGAAKSYADQQIMVTMSGFHQIEESLSSMLPEELREDAQKVVDLAKDLTSVYNQNPEGYTIVLCVALGLPLLFAYNIIYGGFNGILKPAKVIENLQDSDTILVDIRSKEERMRNGVPLLKLAARGKGVAIPYPVLSPELSRKVSNKRNLCIEMLGMEIKSIAKISQQTNIVVMDSKGEMAKEVARACRRSGLSRVYMMDGGFDRYSKEGLQIDGRDFYEQGPLAIVADTAETLKNETKTVFGKSENVALTLVSVTLAGLVVSNLHEVLKFIGVLGLEATVLLRYIVGDEDLGDDLVNIYSTLQSMYPRSLTKQGGQLEGKNE